MNAIAPPALPADAAPATLWPDADRASAFVGRLAALYAGLELALLAAQAAAPAWAGGVAWLAAGAVAVPLAGLLATRPLAAARARAGIARPMPAAPRSGRWARLARPWRRRVLDEAGRLGRLARRPQGVIVPGIAGCAVAILAAGDHLAGTAGPHATVVGIAAIVLGFPLLIAERLTNAQDRSSLPEAPGLRALLFVPVAVVPLAGLIELGASAGLPFMRSAAQVLAVAVGAVALELAGRALANWFLPPPAAAAAKASVGSVLAPLLQPRRLRPRGLNAPIKAHLGIDFSRSWALRFARVAAAPVGLALGLIAWGLTGVTLVEQDRRAVYERFGEPAAVWGPGAHLGLPWPLGRVRRVDLGQVHAVVLGADPGPALRTPAEAPPPEAANRLWDQVHPSEVSFLLASRESDGRQGFQTVNVDMTVLFRTGLDDAAALAAAYAVESPDALVRAEAGRLMARELAGTELSDALGHGREALADDLQSRLQATLDGFASGIQLVAVSIEAIHPPPAAASAYHAVQAAQIVAETAISTERGRALAAAARNRQMASELVLSAAGAAAETTGRAHVASTAFAADRAASATGGEAFLLERYLASLSAALVKAPLVIIDRDLTDANAPSIDLRSFGAPPARAGGDD